MKSESSCWADYQDLHAGDEVERTGRVMDVAVGDGLLGRVIDPLGKPLDGKGPLNADQRLPVERPAPPIMDRAPVVVPLQTGLKVIDALIPVGRGQRELILGDSQTGKTAIAIDMHLEPAREKCDLCVLRDRPARFRGRKSRGQAWEGGCDGLYRGGSR